MESLEVSEFFEVCLTKFKNNQILLNKISHRFLLTTKLFTGWKSLIDIYWDQTVKKKGINFPTFTFFWLKIYVFPIPKESLFIASFLQGILHKWLSMFWSFELHHKTITGTLFCQVIVKHLAGRAQLPHSQHFIFFIKYKWAK